MEFPNPDDIMNFNVTLLPDEVVKFPLLCENCHTQGLTVF
jgi:hypothetical protein